MHSALRLVEDAALSPREAMVDFLAQMEGERLERNTLIYYRSALRQLVAWLEAEGKQLPALRARDMRLYLAARKQGGASDATRYHDACVARRWFAHLRAEGLISENPMNGVRASRGKTPAMYVPTAEEVDRLLRAVRERWDPAINPKARFASQKDRTFRARCDYAVLLLIKETGCRLSEACGLKSADICTMDGAYGCSTVTYRDTKTDTDRTVPVSPAWLRAYQQYANVRPRCDRPEAFLTPYRTPLDPHWMCHKVKDYVEYAGLPSGLTAHGLRRYKATLYAAAGDVKAGSAMLGHSPRVLLEIYAKARPEDCVAAFRRSEAVEKTSVARLRRKW